MAKNGAGHHDGQGHRPHRAECKYMQRQRLHPPVCEHRGPEKAEAQCKPEVAGMQYSHKRLGYLKPVMDGYTMAAGKGVHFWCFAQSISALDSSWGKEHRKTLLHLAEAVQVLGFPRTDAEGAEELSKAIGTATFEGRTESRSGTIAESRIVTANTQWQAGDSRSLVRERLVTPDELMTLGPDRQYVIAARPRTCRATHSISITPATGDAGTRNISPIPTRSCCASNARQGRKTAKVRGGPDCA